MIKKSVASPIERKRNAEPATALREFIGTENPGAGICDTSEMPIETKANIGPVIASESIGNEKSVVMASEMPVESKSATCAVVLETQP